MAEVIPQSLVPEHSATVLALVVESLGHCLLLDYYSLLGTGDGLLGVRCGHFGTSADHLRAGADPLGTTVSGPAHSNTTDSSTGAGSAHTDLGSGDTGSASGGDAASAGNSSLGSRALSTRDSGGARRGGYNAGAAPPWAATQNAMRLLGRIGGGESSFDHGATEGGFGLGVGNRELGGCVGPGTSCGAECWDVNRW